MDDQVDVQRERERALARREARGAEQLRRRRAGMVLSGRWNASRAQLKTAIAERYPSMEPGEQAALLDTTLEIQREGRPKIDPSTIHTRPPAPERLDRKAPKRAPRPEPEAPMEEDTEMAGHKFKPEQRRRFRDWLRGWRAEHPDATQAAGLEALSRQFGVDMDLTVFRRTYWIKAAPPKSAKRAPAQSSTPPEKEAWIGQPPAEALGRETASGSALSAEVEKQEEASAPAASSAQAEARPDAPEADASAGGGGETAEPVEAEAAPEREITPAEVHNLSLILGFRRIVPEVAAAWDAETRRVVAEYLSACIADVNDNVVEIPPMPYVLAPLGYYPIRPHHLPVAEASAEDEEPAESYRGADRVTPNGNGAHPGTAEPKAIGNGRGAAWIGESAQAVSEIVDGERELRASERLREAERAIQDLLQEVQSLRGTYELGEFVRIEEEDGEWMLRMSLRFPDRVGASRVAAHLFAACATREEVARG